MNKIIKGFIIIATIMMLFSIGYYFGFSNGYQTDGLIRSYVQESEDFIWLCNDYDQPYYSCDHDKQFQNITGFYCDGRLVCENQLRKTHNSE